MRITLDFEPVEIPAIIAQLARLLQGDVAGLAAAVIAAQNTSDGGAAAQPPTPPEAALPSEVFADASPVAVQAATDKPKRRGPKPKAAVPAPHTTPVELPFPEPSLGVAPVKAAAPVYATQPSAPATGHGLTSNDVRAAYAAAELRRLPEPVSDEAMDAFINDAKGLLKKYGVAGFGSVAADKYGAVIADLNAL